MDQVQLNLLQHQSTAQKTKKFFIIFLIILFILILIVIITIFTILKHHFQSQSTIQTIRSACQKTQYYYPCITSISSIHKSHSPFSKIDASYIFGLSIQAAYFQFYNISKLPEKLASRFENKEVEPALRDCQNMFNISLTHLHKSWILTKNFQGRNGKILTDEETVTKLRISIESAIYDMQSCVDELEAKGIQWRILKTEVKVRIFMAKACMLNSLAILENQYGIEKIINPGLKSIFASFILSREHYVLSIFLFCSQYLVLIFLFCCLLRVLISRPRK